MCLILAKCCPDLSSENKIKEDQWLTEPYVLTLYEVNDRENYFVTGRCSSGFNVRPNG